jgi:acyl-CoA synthetase (AMP-forming)/AMP-acid ligase II
MSNFAARLLSSDTDATAVVVGGRAVTYQDLRSNVGRWAARMIESGLVPGNCVVILGDNSLFHVVAYLATLYAGGVAVPLSPSTSTGILRAEVRTSRARWGFAERKYVERLHEASIDSPLERVWVDEGSERKTLPMGWESAGTLQATDSGVRHPPVSRSADDVAVVNFTSGSTGAPLGVMVSHRNLEANTRSIVSCLALTHHDRALLVLPMSYCFGASVLHTHLAVGGSIVIASSFAYPERVLDELTASASTGFYGVPSTYQILLRRSTFTTRQCPDLRYMAQAGGHLAPVFIEEIRAAFPAVPFYVMYGQTEATARLSYLPPESLATKAGSVGRGIPGVTLRVLRPDGHPVAVGEVGEIVASGDNIALGYLGDPAATAAHFRDGHLWTGDMAAVDGDGDIFIRGRQRDFIKVGGERVGSREVEDVIADLPDVVEVAVVGSPHDTLGEAIAAYIVARPLSNLDADHVIRHCRLRLGRDREPKLVEFRKELPKSESGKILKAALRRAEAGSDI